MKILVAEDDPVSRIALMRVLQRWGDEVVLAKDGIEASRLLQEPDGPKLAILDWMMPGADGPEVCRQIRQQASESYIYALILTSRDKTEDIIAALEAGADDYLSKPFVPAELKARLLTGRRIIDLQQQLIKAREDLRVEATHDSLTGLYNRRAILETFHREVSRVEREGGHLMVSIADIDHFKRINDTHGHAAGDAVLRGVAQMMQASIRPYDSIGRYGGEEFLFLSPGCDVTNALKLAERIRQCISSERIKSDGIEIAVTLSMGVAVYRATEDAMTLIAGADAALYQAKSRGRNRVELFRLD